MHFSATILALAASASAVAVPRATADYWLARVSKYDDPSLSTSVTASFKSEANPNDSRFASFTCLIDDKETPNWCDRDGVSAEFDGKTLKLSQHVENPNPATVFGEGEVVLEYSEFNKASYGDATIYVSSAVA
ncbi:hypothetical protein N0V91_007252 [Didymella pomorum]|uniref:AA1-like domain-containing protein n=1 Tax=Didymella pomorum TaxID=749634 RepID=A0A9W9D520_9PLEO|nr:hypothetical protein N0V91_007252 [Didymella pomorum]